MHYLELQEHRKAGKAKNFQLSLYSYLIISMRYSKSISGMATTLNLMRYLDHIAEMTIQMLLKISTTGAPQGG
jgi:hypothetical protein